MKLRIRLIPHPSAIIPRMEPIQCRSEVCVLDLEAVEPFPLVRPGQLRLGLLRQFEEKGGVALLQPGPVRGFKLFAGILAKGFQHPKAVRQPAQLAGDQGTFLELGEALEEGCGSVGLWEYGGGPDPHTSTLPHFYTPTHSFSCLPGPPAAEDGEG